MMPTKRGLFSVKSGSVECIVDTTTYSPEGVGGLEEGRERATVGARRLNGGARALTGEASSPVVGR
jgi:hypothetical protein